MKLETGFSRGESAKSHKVIGTVTLSKKLRSLLTIRKKNNKLEVKTLLGGNKLNASCLQKVDYISYLETFDRLFNIPRGRKNQEYRNYLVALLEYLVE